MSIITKENNDLNAEELAALQSQVDAQGIVLTDHEVRIDDLEATNPESLRGLADVAMPALTDGFIVKY